MEFRLQGGFELFPPQKKKTDNSLVALPNKATTSTLLVGALKSDILISVPAFFKVAKLDFWRAYCIFANRRSVFLFNALRNCQISGLTRGKDISTQLSEGSYFAKRFETSSWSSFLFQRLLAISANCLLMGGLFFSSSLKVAVKHFSLVFVRSRFPHFRSQASTESRPRGRVSRLPNPCEMSLSLLSQKRSNRFGAFFDPSCPVGNVKRFPAHFENIPRWGKIGTTAPKKIDVELTNGLLKVNRETCWG